MTDFYHPSTPVSQATFRDNTAKAAVMAGVNTIPSMTLCKVCQKRRTTRTGSFSKGRFTCHGCAK